MGKRRDNEYYDFDDRRGVLKDEPDTVEERLEAIDGGIRRLLDAIQKSLEAQKKGLEETKGAIDALQKKAPEESLKRTLDAFMRELQAAIASVPKKGLSDSTAAILYMTEEQRQAYFKNLEAIKAAEVANRETMESAKSRMPS